MSVDNREQEDDPQDDAIGPESVVSLTPGGRALLEDLFAYCSAQAGRPIDIDELIKVIKQVRTEMHDEDPDYTDPDVLECFHKHLRGPAR